jgi:hypothetical protein
MQVKTDSLVTFSSLNFRCTVVPGAVLTRYWVRNGLRERMTDVSYARLVHWDGELTSVQLESSLEECELHIGPLLPHVSDVKDVVGEVDGVPIGTER